MTELKSGLYSQQIQGQTYVELNGVGITQI